jgi:hypothetical protein
MVAASELGGERVSMEPRGRERHRWARNVGEAEAGLSNRKVKWAGAHESMRAPSEFQYLADEPH